MRWPDQRFLRRDGSGRDGCREGFGEEKVLQETDGLRVFLVCFCLISRVFSFF